MNRSTLTGDLQRLSVQLVDDYGQGRRRVDWSRVVRGLTSPEGLPADLKEESDLLARASGAEVGGGFFLPASYLTRDLSAGVGASGGILVGSQVGMTTAALRPISSVLSAGAKLLPVSGGNISFPRIATGSTLEFLAELVPVPAESAFAFGAVVATPKRAAGYLIYSRQLAQQSSIDVASFIEGDLRAALASTIDRVALVGSGVGPEPLGILSTPGVGSFSFASNPPGLVLATALQAVADLGAVNSSVMASPLVRRKLQLTARFSAGSPQTIPVGAVWGDGKVMDQNGYVDGNLSGAGNRVVVGDFSQLAVVLWGVEVLSDPFTQALKGQIRIVINALFDVCVLQPKAFSVSTDSVP